MIRTNQGGSVASFIVVAALLVLGTAGLLYWTKRGDNPRAASPGVAVSPTSSEKKSTPKTGETDSQKVDEGTNTQTNDTSRSSDEKKTSEDKSQTTNSQPVTQLSQTGPADTLLQILMAGVLTAAFVAYLQSLKQPTPRRSSL